MIRSEVHLGAIETLFTPSGSVVSTYYPGEWDGRYRDPVTISDYAGKVRAEAQTIHDAAIYKWEHRHEKEGDE